MSIAEHLAQLRALHDRYRKSGLHGEDAARYAAGVDRLLAETLAQQEATAGRSAGRRRAIRLRRAVAVDLEWSTGSCRGLTLDVGPGGFSVLLGAPPPPDEPIVAVLRLRRSESVRSAARITNVAKRQRIVRVSMAFVDVPVDDAIRLREYLVEELLPGSPPVEMSAWGFGRATVHVNANAGAGIARAG